MTHRFEEDHQCAERKKELRSKSGVMAGLRSAMSGMGILKCEQEAALSFMAGLRTQECDGGMGILWHKIMSE
jgi:hypothetical protein